MLCRGMCTWSRMQRITECTGVWHTCASSPLPLLSAAASRSRCADLVTVLSSLHAQASSPPKWCSIGGREALRCLCFPAGLLLTGGRQLHDGVHCQTIYTRRLHLCCRRQRQQTCRSCKQVQMEHIARPSSEPQGRSDTAARHVHIKLQHVHAHPSQNVLLRLQLHIWQKSCWIQDCSKGGDGHAPKHAAHNPSGFVRRRSDSCIH